MQNVIAKINLKTIVENAKIFQRRTGGKVCAVVKADAYGHGAERVAFALADTVDFFAVATETEGLKIKTATCGKEILVLTPPACEQETESLVRSGLSVSIGSLQDARSVVNCVKKTGERAFVHLKLNTGMNRYGIEEKDLDTVCRFLKGRGQVCVQGVYSHLYGGKKSTLEKQRIAFERGAGLCRTYFPNVLRHLSATLGATLSEEFYFDAVRIGLGLYGYLPNGVPACVKRELPLQKAMTVYARAQSERAYISGGAGYGEVKKRVERKLRKKGVSILRVGYADGFLRDGKKKSVSELQANDLCMDACPVVGRREKGEYFAVVTDAEQTAKRTGTTAYEVLCACTKRAEFEYEYE